MTDKNTKFLIIFLFLVCCLQLTVNGLFAQDDLAQLKEAYFKKNQYSELVDYLKRFRKDNPLLPQISYYIALARYEQLKYLEETQNWQEYFNLGEEYRQELIQEALDAVKLTSRRKGAFFIYAKCLLWQFHKYMQDAEEKTALGDLLSAVKEYSGMADVDLSAVKYVADTLFSYGDRLNSSKVYDIYLSGLATSLEEDREAKLISLAKQLAYRDNSVVNPFFAEEVFKKVNELNPDLILDEQTQYLRAYNLEKIKQYKEAYPQFQILVQNYHQSVHYAEAIFKMGVISAYILQDIPAAQAYFIKLTESSSPNPQVFASLYQLGLISQYHGDISKARDYYNTLLERSQGITFCEDLVSKAGVRLKEIGENRPLEFNLKTFMDASFKGTEGIVYSPNINVDIKAQYFNLVPNQDVQVSSFALPLESGCMPVSLEYLWSGDLASASLEDSQDSFVTHYIHPGTKLIQLSVVTPSGVLGYNLLFLDVSE